MNEQSRLRDSDRKVRVHLSAFDRTKFIFLFVGVYLILVWAALADNPLLSFSDGCIQISKSRWWLFALLGVEIVRQLHFLLSELD